MSDNYTEISVEVVAYFEYQYCQVEVVVDDRCLDQVPAGTWETEMQRKPMRMERLVIKPSEKERKQSTIVE